MLIPATSLARTPLEIIEEQEALVPENVAQGKLTTKRWLVEDPMKPKDLVEREKQSGFPGIRGSSNQRHTCRLGRTATDDGSQSCGQIVLRDRGRVCCEEKL